MEALRQVEGWPCAHVAVAVAGCVEALHGDTGRPFSWTSVTKLATAVAVLVAAEEGIVDLDESAGPPGSTVRHLLAHASGLPFEGAAPVAAPGVRRIYSNTGFEQVGALVAERAEMPFAAYFEAVWGFALAGSPAHGAEGSLEQLLTVARELLEPSRISRETLDEAVSVQFPGLEGVLPGFGRTERNDWGLGFELRASKSPHWTGARNSPRTFGHFGRSGTFIWVDPEAGGGVGSTEPPESAGAGSAGACAGKGIALACLTDLDFGDWARDAWPRLSDAVLVGSSG